tara:strand:- start:7142 stop:8245 length:1104 start_codon:yes stop_codon:yes gene_type:complete
MFDRRIVSNFDWPILILTLIISSVGIVFIYSAMHGVESDSLKKLYMTQIIWAAYGLTCLFFILLFDYRHLARFAYLLYFLTLLSLVFVLLFGKKVSGAQRWLTIGSFTFQASEMAKIILIITLAKYFGGGKLIGEYKLKDFVIPGILTIIPFLLIVKQPDLGTSMVLLFILFVMILIIETHQKTLLLIMGTAILILPLSWFFLKDYQKERLLTLIDPNIDPLGSGYHILQSRIAIGSGGFWGKGLLAGTQSRLHFLPEQHTDFIFSVLAEEMGFAGSCVLLILYLILFIRALDLISKVKDRFGMLLGLGIISTLFFYVVFNIGMTIGLFPVVGIPLPLMSYGGSSIVSTYIAIGIILNIGMRRFSNG